MPPKPIQPILIKILDCISQRLAQMGVLNNHKSFPQIIKDEEQKLQTRRNLRLIKQNQLLRISEQDRALNEVPSLKYFSRQNVLLLQQDLVQVMGKYLSLEFTSNKRGIFQDLVLVFQKYYSEVKMTFKAREMIAIRNLDISEEVDFAKKNLTIFAEHTRQSMNNLLNRERVRFYNATRQVPRQYGLRESIQKRHGLSLDNQDESPRRAKKKYTCYIVEMSKLLVLQSGTMSTTVYFQKSENVDSERKMSILESTFSKKNQQVRDSINDYSKQYQLRSNRT